MSMFSLLLLRLLLHLINVSIVFHFSISKELVKKLYAEPKYEIIIGSYLTKGNVHPVVLTNNQVCVKRKKGNNQEVFMLKKYKK